jgi:hypothetical protein
LLDILQDSTSRADGPTSSRTTWVGSIVGVRNVFHDSDELVPRRAAKVRVPIEQLKVCPADASHPDTHETRVIRGGLRQVTQRE